MPYVHVSLTNLKDINVPVNMIRAFERAEAGATGEQVFVSLRCTDFDTKLKERKKSIKLSNFTLERTG